MLRKDTCCQKKKTEQHALLPTSFGPDVLLRVPGEALVLPTLEVPTWSSAQLCHEAAESRRSFWPNFERPQIDLLVSGPQKDRWPPGELFS
jgi:hypothetical protein